MRLEVFYNATKITERVENYMDDAYDVALFAKDTDFIYFGHYKELNALFIQCSHDTPSIRNEMLLQYWNGSAWTAVVGMRDDSRGLDRAGFVVWDREQASQVKTTYQSIEGFWYRISVKTAEIPNLSLKGVNLVFSDDRDLASEFPSIKNYLSDDVPSFIGFHQAARDEIISDLRNHGKTVSKSNDYIKKLDQFDLMDFEEIRQASKFKALEKIFFWLSDSNDDKYSGRKNEYKNKYGIAKQQAFLTIDKNDDGKTEPQEQKENAFGSVRIIRE